MHSNHNYNKDLKKISRSLRKNLTKSEAALWNYCLKSNQLGYKFKRQRPILSYIVDFYCREIKLVIELNGITHTYENVVEKDVIKENDLINNGFHVLRFSDEEILTQINRVRARILLTIEEIKSTASSP